MVGSGILSIISFVHPEEKLLNDVFQRYFKGGTIIKFIFRCISFNDALYSCMKKVANF